jgi:hypothetical protein
MMMSQMEIMEKGRRLVSPILASMMALVPSLQLPVQCSDRQVPYIEPQVQCLDGIGFVVQPAPHVVIRRVQYAIELPVHLVQCLLVEALALVVLLVVVEEEDQHPHPLRMEDITAEVEAMLLILHKDMWKFSRGE